jgi:carbon storage regulator
MMRQRGESLLIGDAVEITLLRVKGETVQLGVVAPRNVAIERGEIYRQQPPAT